VPVWLVVAIPLIRFTRIWPEVLGIGERVAAICFVVVAENADDWSCPPSGEVVTRTPGRGER
jgi:hypothetical protein